MKIAVAVLFVLGAVTLSQDSKQESEFDLASARAAIEKANRVYGDRFRKNDSEMYVERYCHDAAAFPNQHPVVSGRDAIRKYYFDDGKNTELTIVIKALDVYGSASLVVEEGTYDFPDGKGGSFDTGKFIALWKMEDGKWKIFREIWNGDRPESPGK